MWWFIAGHTVVYISHIRGQLHCNAEGDLYSGQMRGLINKGSRSPAPLGLPAIICTLTACAHCLLINYCPTCSEGGVKAAVSFTWTTLVFPTAATAAAVGSLVIRLRWDPEEHVPLRTARDCRTEWMAAFTAINSLLPNYLIHHMHTRLLGTANTPTHTSHPPLLPPWFALINKAYRLR